MVTTGIRVGVWVIKNTVSATVRVVYGGADVHDGDFWGGGQTSYIPSRSAARPSSGGIQALIISRWTARAVGKHHQ